MVTTNAAATTAITTTLIRTIILTRTVRITTTNQGSVSFPLYGKQFFLNKTPGKVLFPNENLRDMARNPSKM